MCRSKFFTYSIIMAIYNTAPYLNEAVESVLQQSIGFEEHVQLILVDDGSTDGSGWICDGYRKKYPNNVTVLYQKHCGVSAARNLGLEMAEGKYLGFLDSDDRLSYNTLQNVAEFFQLHQGEVDVISIPIYWFDGKTGEHILNYKYHSGSRIISLGNEPECIQLSISSAFIRREVFCQTGKRFDDRLAVAEDAKLLQEILIEKQRLGVVAGCQYYYRKRTGKDRSALQRLRGEKHWYEDHLQHFALGTFAHCKKVLGVIPRFIQFAILYDLQWRLIELMNQNTPASLDIPAYKMKLDICLQAIDADIILAQKHISKMVQLYLMQLKFKCIPQVECLGQEFCFRFPDNSVIRKEMKMVIFDFISLKRGSLKIEGRFTFPFCGTVPEIFLQWNDHMIDAERVTPSSRLYQPKIILGDRLEIVVGFRVELPLDEHTSQYRGTVWCRLWNRIYKIGFGKFGEFCPIGSELKYAYYMEGPWTITTADDAIILEKQPTMVRIVRRIRYLKELWYKGQEGQAAVLFRMGATILKKLMRKPVWLISDRLDTADDNGEAFFQFLIQRKEPVHLRFLLVKDSVDRSRLKKMGVVVSFFSIRHRLCHLLCNYILSSHADHYTTNPFGESWIYYRDILCRPKFVFLQHGIIKDDLSDWLNRYSKNIYGFVVSTQKEWESVAHGRYDYSANHIWLTGLCRYDLLYHNENRLVTIMPTWRKYLMGRFSEKTGKRMLNVSFKESDYFQFYSALLTNTQLLNAARRYGYQLCFHPHPLLMPYIKEFARDENVSIFPPEKRYRDIFAESELIVTDYSSTAFDFAYLRKPILYCRPDHDKFVSGLHTYTPGYFSYQNDGFGEITYSLSETVEQIIAYIKNHCVVKPVYRDRINKFFTYSDTNCRLRLLEKLKRPEYEED